MVSHKTLSYNNIDNNMHFTKQINTIYQKEQGAHCKPQSPKSTRNAAKVGVAPTIACVTRISIYTYILVFLDLPTVLPYIARQ